MGSAHVENGYVRIANDLLDAVLRYGFSKRELLIMLALIRKTYGFNKKTDALSCWQLAEITNISQPNVSRTIKSLVDRNIVLSGENGGRYSHGYFISQIGINKHFSEWLAPMPKQQPLPKRNPLQNGNSTYAKTATAPMPKRQHQKTTSKDNPKDNPKDSERALRFDAFWQAYPVKKGKAPAQKKFYKINPNESLFAEIMAGLENAKQSEQWNEKGGKYVPHPSTWLNNERWTDEYESSTYDPAEGAI